MNNAPSSPDAKNSVPLGVVPDRVSGPAEDVRQDPLGQPEFQSARPSRAVWDCPWVRCKHRSGLNLSMDQSSVPHVSPRPSFMGLKEVIHLSNVTVIPKSGVQLIIIVGAAFLMAGVHPQLGMNLLLLGVGVWAIYNLLNFGRQF